MIAKPLNDPIKPPQKSHLISGLQRSPSSLISHAFPPPNRRNPVLQIISLSRRTLVPRLSALTGRKL